MTRAHVFKNDWWSYIVVKENSIQIIGIIAGICTSISLLPQLIKVIKTKKAEDLSIFYLIILSTGILLWIWYGKLRNDVPILATNSFSLLVNIVLIIFGVKYKKESKPQRI